MTAARQVCNLLCLPDSHCKAITANMKKLIQRPSLRLVGNTELDLVKQAVVLGLRCTSTSMRNKWTGLLPKLLRRIFMSVHAALNRQRAAVSKTGRGPHVEADLHASEDLQGLTMVHSHQLHWWCCTCVIHGTLWGVA